MNIPLSFLFAFFILLRGLVLYSQNPSYTIDFEGSVPAVQDYLNGSEQPLGTSYSFSTPYGPVIFPNFFDTLYGGFWVQGWALSRKADSSTANVSNVYGVKALTGNSGSETFAVGLSMARLRTNMLMPGTRVKSLYVTNTTWNYEAMRQGLGTSKIFGGLDGTEPDFFKLVVKRYVGGVLQADSAEIYLADYRFPGASPQDYILKTWTKLELNLPTPMDSLLFILRSSDVGLFGMNTPPYFAVDDVEVEGAPTTGVSDNSVETFSAAFLSDGNLILKDIKAGEYVQIYDISGRLYLSFVSTNNTHVVTAASWPSGLYVLRLSGSRVKILKP
jgi:hypothetical protein